MDGLSLKERYGHLAGELARFAQAGDIIDETNVYQPATPGCRRIMDGMISDNLLPGSRLEGRENFTQFLEYVKSGKRGLLLMEHYSNMDLPALCYLLDHDSDSGNNRKGEEGETVAQVGKEISARLIAIAGMKLNEENPLVKSYAEGYSRIVIYPSRSLASIADREVRAQEEARSRKINMAAMRALDGAKKRGQVVLVFPSGTRYRPGKPETKRGLREMDSYLRTFDVMLLLSVNGSILRINPEKPNDMLADQVFCDKVVVAASKVIECKQFRNEVIESVKNKPDIDIKQATVDKAMALLEIQHEKYEKIRFAD
jgi:glycerol-3-phosphate O-acyltransferase